MSLRETLDSIKAGAKGRIPAEALTVMAQATTELENSGLVEHAIGVRQRAPEFSLENFDGELYASLELLAQGPLVVNFYRGSW